MIICARYRKKLSTRRRNTHQKRRRHMAARDAGNSVASSMDNATSARTTEREIILERIFDAPRELVFEAWTDPQRIGQWWGPRGFTTTVYGMDVRPGGEWRLTMHGPDGRDYKNRSSISKW
jgi:activator of HSP90 ATPase